jgi:7-cyano-7-deazaguanine reductase
VRSYNSSALSHFRRIRPSIRAAILISRLRMPSRPRATVETFANPAPGRDYVVHIEVPEFTCLCPLTGQPDFATLVFDYIPDRRNVELKSLKLYMWSFRDQGAFHEAVTNRILDDLVAATQPRYMKLEARFNVRGGIYTSVIAEHRKRGWAGKV